MDPHTGKDTPATGVVDNESHYHSKKNRVFVRGIQGDYSLKEELARLRAMPRVRKGRVITFTDGPQCFSRHYVEPKDGITQTFHLHLEEYGPGGRSQKHGNTKPARALVIKTKPMFMFMNMLFQKQIEPRPSAPAPGGEGFQVREREDNFNHKE